MYEVWGIEMKKIPTLFVRDESNMSRVTDEVTPGCEWVLAGEGLATIKWDGTSCMIRSGVLYKRREVKDGKPVPVDFIEESQANGKRQGWVPVTDDPSDKYHRAAFALLSDCADGTYELVGPKVQGNPYGRAHHELVPHGDQRLVIGLVSFDSVRDFLRDHAIEGVVWHHPDGRMAKIKRRDFGFAWPEDCDV